MPHYMSPDGMVAPPSEVAHHDGDVFMPITITIEGLLVLVNILPIAVVMYVKHSHERLSTDHLVIALSITDILSVLIPTPFSLTSYWSDHWIGGHITCDLYQVTTVWFQLSSMCLITLMCVDRWVALRDSLYCDVHSQKIQRTRRSIVAIYIACLVFACIPLFGLAPRALTSSGVACQSWITSAPTHPLHHVFYIAFLCVGFVNLFVTFIVNSQILRLLWQLKHMQLWSQASSLGSFPVMTEIDQRSIKEMSVMTIMVTTIFCIAWMPALVSIHKPFANVFLSIVVYSTYAN